MSASKAKGRSGATKTKWERLVSLGRDAVGREEMSKWELGDLALEIQPPRSKGFDALREYANDIGADFERLVAYRRIAEFWKPAERLATASWTVHREIYRLDASGRLKGKPFMRKLAKKKPPRSSSGRWTRNAVRREAGLPMVKNQAIGLEDQAVDERVALLAELLDDPETLEAAMNDRDISAAVERAAGELEVALKRRVQQHKKRSRGDDIHKLAAWLGDVRQRLVQVYEELGEAQLDADARDLLLAKAERVKNAADFVVEALEVGTIDDAISDLLREEA
jgi:hypothetical protein